MELSAVLSLKDKLSANMDKASNSIGSMITKANEANNAILSIAKSRGINITATTNIQETVDAAKASITDLQKEIEQRKINLEGLAGDVDTLSFEEINSQISNLTKELENPKKSLEEIRHAKEALANWQEIGIQYEALVKAETEVEVLEKALEQINSTNVAVRAYVDFKKDALQQIYDIDKKVVTIKTAIQDKASPIIEKIKTKLQPIANKVFQPIVKIKDMATTAINKIKTPLAKLAGTIAYPIVKIKDAASPIISKVGEGLKSFAGKTFTAVAEIKDKATPVLEGIKKAASSVAKVAKGIAVAVGAGAAAVGAIVTQSVNAFADYEQLTGGVETLFKDSAPIVEQYAKNAYKTAGLSANNYMETVTSFSASLLQSLGGDTAKAASYADLAITDMSDNANKMGTSMESIQNAYQGFAKQNYTMLDNLKLGYGGTKEEMQRLLNDAEKLSGQKFDLSSYADIVQAIHIVQESMDITGTTAKEAEHTISGSLASMKAAWGNTLTALVTGGEFFDTSVDALVNSVLTFIDNIEPAIEGALGGIGHLIDGLAPVIERELPVLIDKLLPSLINATIALVKGLIAALPGIIKVLINEFPNIAKQLGDAFMEAFGIKIPLLEQFGNFFSKNADVIAKSVPYLLGFVGAFTVIKGITSKISSIKGAFGKNDAVGSIATPFESLANVKTSTVLKGVANLAIIIGGLTAIAAGLMAVAPHIAKLSDTNSLIKVIAVIGVLGLVGSALATLAGLVGKIPVSSVALGLANIAIIVSGVSALFLLIGAESLISFDTDRILQIVKIIAILGTVGAVLSVFAGIVGMIPIPVVLAGLANMALVLGGVSAIILAFGALSEIPRFDEFISKGGETLANLFNIIGQIAGSLIGGIGEGVTNSLPKIGENLSAFAKSLEPMITMFSGVDLSGMGDFFSSISSFMLKIAGNNILSFFTGGTNFAELGTELTNFATNASGFFNTVAGLPENGFTNAAALFQSLSDIGNVPNTGGIAQWFSGTNDFAALAEGLKQLSDDGVMGFFTKVSGISAESFENAKALFQSLADIGNIPNTGGIAQWFSGTNDFAGLTANLPPFGEAMAAFYSSISGISDYSRISQLFEALHGIGEAFPNSGGIAQWFSGTNDISGTGAKLKEFGENTTAFFSSVTALNVDNLKGVFESVKLAGEVANTDLSNLPDKGTQMTTFMTNAKGFFEGAAGVTEQIEAVNQVAETLQSFFAIVAGIVSTNLSDINSGMQNTVTMTQTATTTFNQLAITILAVMSIAQTAIEGMSNAFTQGLATILQTTQNTMNSIKSAVQSLSLYSAGVNIMSGLNRGMLSMKGSLIATANSIAKSVSTTINKALEIKSPSRVTTRSGRFTGQGLAKGITEMVPVVQRQTNRLVSVVTEPFDDEPLPVTAGGGNSGGYGGLRASIPVSQTTTTNNTNTSTTQSNTSSKRTIIQNLIGSVTVRDEADEDRLVDKIIRILADEVEEADNNMGEGDYA